MDDRITSPSHRAAGHARRGQSGFTLIELMVALTVLLIGVSGILGMHLTSMRATAYSRHATEAAVLGENMMEELRTIPTSQIAPNLTGITMDAQGIEDPQGMYTVKWDIVWDAQNVGTQTVWVEWLERGKEQHAVVMRTQRNLTLPTTP